jgi:hypothetical protein
MHQILEGISNNIKSIGIESEIINVEGIDFIKGKKLNGLSESDIPVYLLLDTYEGKDCIGHWLWECANYLLYFKSLKLIYPKLKILFAYRKKYKEIFYRHFNISDDDISYNGTINKLPDYRVGNMRYNGCFGELVIPNDSNFILIIPRFTFPWHLAYNKDEEYRMIFRNFKNALNIPNNIKKNVDFIYLIRSIDVNNENFKSGTYLRNFHNLDDVINLMNKKGIKIIDVTKLSTLQEQIDIIQSARNIIVEHGSAWFINGLILSSNSHIITLNKNPIKAINLELNLLKEQNNTFEFLESTNKDYNNIIIDISYLEKRIDFLFTNNFFNNESQEILEMPEIAEIEFNPTFINNILQLHNSKMQRNKYHR